MRTLVAAVLKEKGPNGQITQASSQVSVFKTTCWFYTNVNILVSCLYNYCFSLCCWNFFILDILLSKNSLEWGKGFDCLLWCFYVWPDSPGRVACQGPALEALWQQCCSDCAPVRSACCDAVVLLVDQAHADLQYILNTVLNLLPSARLMRHTH